MRLLQVVSTVDPSHGGVAESILQGGLHLRQLGHSVEVATLDAPDAVFIHDYPLAIHALGPGWTAWAYNAALPKWLSLNARRFDAVIVHGLWQFHTVATRMALAGTGVPYMVFPHGMLNPWVKREHPLRHLKKWLVWPWGDYRVLRDASAVLYTCEEERQLARQMFWLYAARERVVPFGTAPPPLAPEPAREAFALAYPALSSEPFLLFLGRLHEKKGCDLLVKAFANTTRLYPGLQLVMAGPSEPRYLAALQTLAHQQGIADRVHWLGMVTGDIKWGCLATCEAFVLPSHQENFGIAVVEALASGKPVLISNKVNIHATITAAGAGWASEDDAPDTARSLARWLTLPEAARSRMGDQALKCYHDHFSIGAMARGLVDAVGQCSG